MSNRPNEQRFGEGELERVNEPGPCPLCGRMTIRRDDGGTWCPDEDSTCWRIGGTAMHAMTLRDHFASQALIGIAAFRMDAEMVRRYMDGKADGREAVAAYALADAMLKAREAK